MSQRERVANFHNDNAPIHVDTSGQPAVEPQLAGQNTIITYFHYHHQIHDFVISSSTT